MRATRGGGSVDLDDCVLASKEDLKAARFAMIESKL
jgi:hypothetical protein